MTPEQRHEIEQFVYAEARALDERRFEDWLALFADEGVYWVPGQPDQQSPTDALSLYYERKALLAVRVNRLAQPSMYAQVPAVRTHHHVSAVEVSGDTPIEARSSLIVAEWRGEEARWFAGRVLHRLERVDGKLRIALKRVDLINCDAPHRALVVPF
jgi:ethylbenzene dioxygenase subunit beta